MAKCSGCKKTFAAHLLRHVTDRVFWFAYCARCYLDWKKETGGEVSSKDNKPNE